MIKTKTELNMTEVVKANYNLVKRIACHLLNRLPPNVHLDDLVQSGLVGLIEAARNFDESKGASFETYAGIRIKGAMLDEMRKGDWTPRSVHRNARRITEVIRQIEHETGRDAKDVDVAKRLEIGLAEYHKMLSDSNTSRVFGFEDYGISTEAISEKTNGINTSPHDSVQKSTFKTQLATEISGLPQKESLVMSLYYDEELNFRNIGDIMGVSESRVSQLHGQAMLRLKARMQNWKDA